MRPSRESIRSNELANFVSTQTACRTSFFRHERWARLMLATINHYTGCGYKLHTFVVMPDHLHLLITPTESIEKSVQLIKGGFSFRAKRDLQWNGEIWQSGFTDHRIRDEEDWQKHLAYIQNNPVNAHLVNDGAHYEFMGMPNIKFPQWLKPTGFSAEHVRAKTRTLQSVPTTGSAQQAVNGTGFSPPVKSATGARALAPEGGKR
jgi:putative transposase